MSNGGTSTLLKSLTQKVSKSTAAIAVGSLALLVGLLSGGTPGQAIGILLFMGSIVFAFLNRRTRDSTPPGAVEQSAQSGSHLPSPDDPMKTLLFDDFQATNGKYHVRQIEEEGKVVPSTKTAKPVAMTVTPETVRTMEIPDFFDLDTDNAYNEAEPRSEFHSLLDKVLLVIKDVLFAHTVAFFWINDEKRQVVLESMATESTCFTAEKRFPIEKDLMSQVAATGKPQVIGHVNATSEQEVLRYYEGPSGVQSALAVPVFFATGSSDITPVAVIVADSKAEDQFGNETLALLGRFTKLVSSLIKSYTDKYDLLLDSELLSSLRRVYDRIGSTPTEDVVLGCLADEANRLATWESLSIVMYSEDQGGWVVQRAVDKGGQPSVTPGMAIDPAGSVVGDVIRNNTVRAIDDLTAAAVFRFHAAEAAPLPGSFLCIPISSFNRCYGALTLESRTPANYRGSEIETIYRLVQNAAALLEVIYMNDMTREHLPVDALTGALNKKHFQRRLEEEVQRAADFGTDLALVSVAVDALDDHSQRYGATGADAILASIAHTLRSNIRPYDAIGRQEDNRLGVLLVQTTSGDAYLWAEKLRKQIAGLVITAGSRSLSVTVSMGIGGLMEGMKMEELASDTDKVLTKAMEHGGNLVRVH